MRKIKRLKKKLKMPILRSFSDTYINKNKFKNLF